MYPSRIFHSLGTVQSRTSVPEGLAHGFQTLEDDSEVFYQMSEFYSADHSRGERWYDNPLSIVDQDD
jgi:dTDP-4-dehydrorhamnose 3,5-epimerase-like enzyme